MFEFFSMFECYEIRRKENISIMKNIKTKIHDKNDNFRDIRNFEHKTKFENYTKMIRTYFSECQI